MMTGFTEYPNIWSIPSPQLTRKAKPKKIIKNKLIFSPMIPVISKKEKQDNLCVICHLNPKDSGFYHYETVHFSCCYLCALQVMEIDGKCPICREDILEVVKVY